MTAYCQVIYLVLSNGVFYNVVFTTLANMMKNMEHLEMPFKMQESLSYCVLFIFSTVCK